MNSADIENNYYEYSGEFNNEKGNIILFSETEIDNSDFHNSSYKSSGKFVPITGNIEQLKHYFDALKDVKIDKIRVAHYGDSIIWADVITPDLRYNLQKKFGGHGAGFLSICSDDIKAKKVQFIVFLTTGNGHRYLQRMKIGSQLGLLEQWQWQAIPAQSSLRVEDIFLHPTHFQKFQFFTL